MKTRWLASIAVVAFCAWQVPGTLLGANAVIKVGRTDLSDAMGRITTALSDVRPELEAWHRNLN